MPMPHVEERKAIGQLLGQLRRQRNLSQEELARRLGVSRAFISQVEAGKKNISRAKLPYVASVLGLSSAESNTLFEVVDLSRGTLTLPETMPFTVRREFLRLIQCNGQPSLGSWSVLERKLAQIAPVSE